MSEKPGKRLVSKTEYVIRKTLAVSLSVGLSICGIAGVLVLLRLPYSSYLDAQYAARQGPNAAYIQDMPSEFALTLSACIIFIPILLVIAVLLWIGSLESWKTVRALQPINFTDTSALPAVETLVRASAVPPSNQQTELLHAAQYGKETPVEELLRATTTTGQDA
jgi:hypothetical protein